MIQCKDGVKTPPPFFLFCPFSFISQFYCRKAVHCPGSLSQVEIDALNYHPVDTDLSMPRTTTSQFKSKALLASQL